MFRVDIYSRVPVYEQIIKQAEDFVSTGILKPGDKIPSVRNLSVKLSVNPNTVQKAYTELDSRGIIFSSLGRGCFISQDAPERVCKQKREKLGDLILLVRELANAGISKEDIYSRIDIIFKEKENE